MQQTKSESAEKAECNSTVIEFYNRCCASAEIKREWHALNPITQQHFTHAVAYVHQVIYNGG